MRVLVEHVEHEESHGVGGGVESSNACSADFYYLHSELPVTNLKSPLYFFFHLALIWTPALCSWLMRALGLQTHFSAFSLMPWKA